jgi:hypothetical protein
LSLDVDTVFAAAFTADAATLAPAEMALPATDTVVETAVPASDTTPHPLHAKTNESIAPPFFKLISSCIVLCCVNGGDYS